MQSFIEKQFPVSKVSKESYKERMSGTGQALTGFGKWWGRKPLVLVRAALLGALMPSSENPKRDLEIFLKILNMDSIGLRKRKNRTLSVKELYEYCLNNKKLKSKINEWFNLDGKTILINSEIDRQLLENKIFDHLSYDTKISLCVLGEQVENSDDQTWREINHHLLTDARNIYELVDQLSKKVFGRKATVGDSFSGGGSIPFEVARLGLNTFSSDLNPIASLLTKANIDLYNLTEGELKEIQDFQKKVLNEVNDEILQLGIEENEIGDRAISYIYCTETICPECKYLVPLSSSWLIGKGSKTVAKLIEAENKSFDIKVFMNASDEEMNDANNGGTITSKGLVCPHCKKTTPISSLRKDRKDENSNTSYGLRQWDKNEFDFRETDIFRERLYAIRFERADGTRYYRSPNLHDLENERKIKDLVASNFKQWQDDGYVPNMIIEGGEKTEEVIRNRGWKYWHQLFNPRQLLTNALIVKSISKNQENNLQQITGLLMINKTIDWNSRLCRWGTGQARESMAQTFYNQALNPIWQYGTRGFLLIKNVCELSFKDIRSNFTGQNYVHVLDARDVKEKCHIWITDPPYADAVNYHELSEFFLAWDKKLLKMAFPDWYTDSKRILAVKGDEHFSKSMIEIYSNLAKHMPDNGIQIVMFTHSDVSVWAQLALIMWKAGLKVTAAWNIATETESGGLKDGNYVKGTVLLVLRKQTGNKTAYLDEINSDIKTEVKSQIESMQALDDKEEPNFSDPDYVLAAYAASLKVLTSYKKIGELDLDYELNLAINNPEESQVVRVIENAKKTAYDLIIPIDFDSYLWKDLSHAEKFFIKCLEAEKHNNYQISTYQEYARGFSISSYNQLMASERANSARLKTPIEFAMRSIGDVPDFEKSILRTILAAIYIAIKEDNKPEKGLYHLKNQTANYWNRRDMIKQLLSFIKDTTNIENMPHWKESADMADHLFVLVDNDHV